ncbi:MAG: beta-exotoxin transport system ATP-binding protein [Actinomycetota bacterium]
MSATAAISTSGLTKQFGDLTAVASLDLDVQRGEVFGFLGPNGAGKTTTIRMLLDILRPTSGSARVLDGAPGDPAVRARIGFLPADLHLDPKHSVRDAIDFYGALRGGFDQPLVDRLLTRFDLDPARSIGDLSTGNRRKVGVIQAFAGHPDLLILDEPTSGLDPLLQHEFLSLVEESTAEGVTVFLSSHVLPEVERVADRIGILRRGELVSLGGIDDVRPRQRLDLHLAKEPPAGAFDRVEGVVEIEVHGNVVSLLVDGSVDAVVKAAARHTVERVVSHETDLEDAFLELYRSPSANGDGSGEQ